MIVVSVTVQFMQLVIAFSVTVQFMQLVIAFSITVQFTLLVVAVSITVQFTQLVIAVSVTVQFTSVCYPITWAKPTYTPSQNFHQCNHAILEQLASDFRRLRGDDINKPKPLA